MVSIFEKMSRTNLYKVKDTRQELHVSYWLQSKLIRVDVESKSKEMQDITAQSEQLNCCDLERLINEDLSCVTFENVKSSLKSQRRG